MNLWPTFWRTKAPTMKRAKASDSAIWRGTMPAQSLTDRLEVIEARLFILARTAGIMAQRAPWLAARLPGNLHSPHEVIRQALNDVNVERMTLIAEREAIHIYLEETRGS